MSRFSASKNSLLQDNSWIRKTDDEDEDVDRDPNFGKIVLSQYRATENLGGSEPEEVTTTKPIRTSTTSVQALTKRFSGSQDELRSSTTTTTVTKDGTTITSTQSLRSPGITSPTTTFTERVKSSSKGAQYSTYSPTKTTNVTETTVTSSKDPEDKLDSLIPPSIKDDFSPTDSKRTVSSTETVTVKSSPNRDSIKTTNTTKTSSTAEDKLYDSLIPSSIKDDFSPTDSKTTVSSTETVTVKSSPNRDGIKTTTTTRISSTAEDDLYDTLLPKSITSSPVSTSIKKRETVTVESSNGYSSYTDDTPSTRTTSYTISTKPSEDYSSDRKTYSYSRPDSSYEYSSITSPSAYTSSSYRSSSRSDDILADPIYSKSSTKSVYASPERVVLEKDLCTYCHKPFNAGAKMVLDDMKISCHASCFKCAVCNSSLGHMKAGDSMWIYKRMVHCENCFEVTREKWRR